MYQFKNQKPHSEHILFRKLSLQIYELFINNYIPDILKKINKSAEKFIMTKHCKGYGEIYKKLIYEIVQTEYLKLLKNVIFSLDDILIYMAIKELKSSKSFNSPLIISKCKAGYSIYPDALLTLNSLLKFRDDGNNLAVGIIFSVSMFENSCEFSSEKTLEALLQYN